MRIYNFHDIKRTAEPWSLVGTLFWFTLMYLIIYRGDARINVQIGTSTRYTKQKVFRSKIHLNAQIRVVLRLDFKL